MTTTALAIRPTELMLAGPLGSLDHYIQAANAIPVLSAEEEFELADPLARDERPRRREAPGLVASALRGARRARLCGLRPAARRPDPGRQHRPHEGRAALRSQRRRAPRFVRGPLDPRRNPRVRAAQLAPRSRRDDQSPAQAVLQSAQGQEAPRLAQPGGGRGRRSRSRRDDAGRRGDGAAA